MYDIINCDVYMWIVFTSFYEVESLLCYEAFSTTMLFYVILVGANVSAIWTVKCVYFGSQTFFSMAHNGSECAWKL